jgi:predicted GNAT family acetyltransferase
MDLVVHGDVQAFARPALPLLWSDPVRHTAEISVFDALCRGQERAATLLTVHDAGEVVGAALRTPGRPVLVSALRPGHAAAVDDALAAADPGLPGVSGPTAVAEAFAVAHVDRTGARLLVEQRTRLFTLDELVAPTGVPGSARHANEGDLDLLAEWRLAFAKADRGAWTSALSPRDLVARSLRLGTGEVLWEVDRVPVAQASARAVTAGMSRIGPVYTPPEHRGRGYAAAVTAAASRWALHEGAEHVLLFTDLANPTTNRLYPRLGYRPLHDALELRFAR